MDKYEYRVNTQEMLSSVAAGDYRKAEKIADGIDWRKVKSVSMLSTVSNIYETQGRYEDARDILDIAYDRAPNSRKIIYGLTELAIRLGDLEDAKECYREYCAVAPHDGNRFVLRYELSRAKGEPIENQIHALEEFKKVEYVERWAYELAKLYEKAGMTDKCIEECDDLILWFSNGRYVKKAMELKRRYRPLTPSQLEKYMSDGQGQDDGPTEEQRSAEILLNAGRRSMEAMQEEEAAKKAERERIMHRLRGEEEPEEAEEAPVSEAGEGLVGFKKELEEEVAAQEEAVYAFREDDDEDEAVEPEDTVFRRPDEPVEAIDEEMILAGLMAEVEAPAEEEPAEETYAEPAEEPFAEAPEEEFYVEEAAAPAVEAEAYAEAPAAEAIEEAPAAVEAPAAEAPDLGEESGGQMTFPAFTLNDYDQQIEGQLELSDMLEQWEEKKRQVRQNYEEEQQRKAEEKKEKEDEAIRKTMDSVGTAAGADRIIPEDVQRLLWQIEHGEDFDDEPEEEAEEEYDEPEETVYAAPRAEEPEEAEPAPAFAEPDEAFFAQQGLEELGIEEAEYEEAVDYPEFDEQDGIDYPEFDEPESIDYPEFDEQEAAAAPEYDEPETAEAAGYDEPEQDAFAFLENESADAAEEKEINDNEIFDIAAALENMSLESLEKISEGQEPSPRIDEADVAAAFRDELQVTIADEPVEEPVVPAFRRPVVEEPKEAEAEEPKEAEAEEPIVPAFRRPVAEGPKKPVAEEPKKPVFEEPVIEKREEPVIEKQTAKAPVFEEPEAPAAEPAKEDLGSAMEAAVAEIQAEKSGKAPVVESYTASLMDEKFDLEAKGRIGIEAGLSEEQQQIFSYFVPVRGMSEQIVSMLDEAINAKRDGTSRTGNLIVTGPEGGGKTMLALDTVKALRKAGVQKSGKAAIILAESLNKKDIPETVRKVHGGALIIEKAGMLTRGTMHALDMAMNTPTENMMVVMEDTEEAITRLLNENDNYAKKFNLHLSIPQFINDELVTFGQTYAQEHGYKIDEMGILALYSRIDVMQREDHAVSVAEVKEIMDAAFIRSRKNSMKKTMTNFFKSKDKTELITLEENDFIH